MLDPSVTTEPDNNKTSKPVSLEGVSFEHKPTIRESPELVQFISAQTGKIKALAAADLESHLGLAQQFLNIGKPFLFEGIGSLVKLRTGEFSFVSGTATGNEYSAREISSASSTQESFSEYHDVLSPRKSGYALKRPFAFILILAGIGLAVWGGYTVYKKSANKTSSASLPLANTNETKNTVADTIITIKDSLPKTEPAIAAGEHKFVLETANAKRAIPRFNKLKSFQWRLQMETKDSVTYKLFLVLPVAAADTTHILDSLTRLYGKRPYIEDANNE